MQPMWPWMIDMHGNGSINKPSRKRLQKRQIYVYALTGHSDGERWQEVELRCFLTVSTEGVDYYTGRA
eukprot:7962174-Karenia_brevis.AAC.1